MTPPGRHSSPSIPDARAAALRLLTDVLRHGRALDDNFDAAVQGLEDRDRAFARLLAATTLRRLGQIDSALAQFMERTPPAMIQDMLRLSAAQILFVGTPAHAAVTTGVELAKRAGYVKFTGLVNAVLRRLTEKGAEIVAGQDATKLNTPGWMWRRWAAAYGEAVVRRIAEAHLIEAPTDVTLKDSTAAHQLDFEVLPTGSLRLNDHGRIDTLPGFADGAWWVQDAAAAMPARILLSVLGEGRGKTVIDLCAAPGGKTLQLAAAGCAVTAVDSSAKRLKLVHENLQRTRLSANVITADALAWRPDHLADAVLLDAPCSSTGTIRRHPDLPYLKKEKDIPKLAQRQRDLLAAAAEMLKPSGVLVYSVCSLEPEEGEGVIAAADLQRQTITNPELAEFLTAEGALRTLPGMWSERGGLDGFYAALLRKAR
jgi:16S rRNA (cytosine967-C5)-methyltransferase